LEQQLNNMPLKQKASRPKRQTWQTKAKDGNADSWDRMKQSLGKLGVSGEVQGEGLMQVVA
jgi:hypothetical protein